MNFFKRYFIPSSVWPLLACRHSDDDYEDGLRTQKDINNPIIVVYRSTDTENNDKAFSYKDILGMIKDGVLDNLMPSTDGAIGVSANDLRALSEFVTKASDVWAECIDRLAVNRMTETKTRKYKLADE